MYPRFDDRDEEEGLKPNVSGGGDLPSPFLILSAHPGASLANRCPDSGRTEVGECLQGAFP